MDTPIASSTVWERCSAELAELQARGMEICAAMRRASQTLQETGSPPANSLIDELSQFRFRFEQVRSVVFPSAAVQASQQDGYLSIQSLTDEVGSRAIVRKALRRLEHLCKIRHLEQPDFLPWQRCLAEGERLRETLLCAPALETRPIAEGFCDPVSPLNAAVSLVVDSTELSDERWQELADLVAKTYGRELTTAIARGKLAVTTDGLSEPQDLTSEKVAR